ncbi:hypothetical protein P3G55_01290 [Leptospira sp. 96542]|nr:hypothetical protein [Leptospira sp. 96542]
MALVQDISDWDKSLFDYSISMISLENIFLFEKHSNKISINKDKSKIYKTWSTDRRKSDLFWLSFSLGVECLFKAVLIKHKSIQLEKKNIDNRMSHLKIEANKSIYQALYSIIPTSRKNEFLSETLINNKIDYLYQIKTPTLDQIRTKYLSILKTLIFQ